MNTNRYNRKLKLGIYSIGLIMMGVIGINSSLAAISAAFPEVSQTMIQNLLSVPCIVIIPTTIMTGKLMSRYSMKRLAVIGTLLFYIGGTLPAFLNSFLPILIMRALLGIGIGICQVIGVTLVVENFSETESQKIQGNLQSAQMIGVAFMVFIGGRLADMEWNYAFLIHLIGLITLEAILFFIPDLAPAQKASEGSSVKLTGRSWLWALLMCAVFITIQVYHVTFSFLISDKGLGTASASGSAISLFAIGGAVMGILYGKLSGFLKQYSIMLGCIAFAGAYLIIANAQTLYTCYIGSVIYGFAIVITLPKIFIQAGLSTNASSAGFAISIVTCAQNLGQFLCPYIINPLSNLFSAHGKSSTVCFLIGASFAVILALIMFIWAKKQARTSTTGQNHQTAPVQNTLSSARL